MMVMAIEAARQLASPVLNPSAYHLTDVTFSNAFPVSSGCTTIEAQMYFYPHKAKRGVVQRSHNFQIFAYVNEGWTETCSGSIEVEVQQGEESLAISGENRLQRPGIEKLLSDYFERPWETISSSQFYENLRVCGYNFGPTFQTLVDLRFTEDGEAASRILLDDWVSKVEKSPGIADHVIHPIDLDGILQSSVAAYSQGSRVAVPVLVPTKLKSFWISSDLLFRKPGQALNISSETTFRGFREAEFSIGAINAENEAQVSIESFRQTFINDQQNSLQKHPQRSCYHLNWRPDIDLLCASEIKDICEDAIDPDLVQPSSLVDRQELVALYYIEKLLGIVSESGLKEAPTHMSKYVRWARHQFNPKQVQTLRQSHVENEKLFGDASSEVFLSTFAKACVEGKLIVKVGQALAGILDGQVDALELLFGGDNILNEYYASASFMPSFTRLATYMDLVMHKNPALKVLEVGAGTGSLTQAVLESATRSTHRSVDDRDTPRVQSYMFTDISPAFFEEARRKFQKHANIMSYATFNLEHNPLDQGFANGQFDIVIASLVLHATTNLRNTLRNVRMVMKPGGKLILFEPCAPRTARVSFIFGLLPGWWLSQEKEREWSPLLHGADWHNILLETGFSGVEVEFPDQPDPHQTHFQWPHLLRR